MEQKRCKNCNSIIDSKDKVCPYCGEKQKEDGCLIGFLIILSVIALSAFVLFILIAVGAFIL